MTTEILYFPNNWYYYTKFNEIPLIEHEPSNILAEAQQVGYNGQDEEDARTYMSKHLDRKNRQLWRIFVDTFQSLSLNIPKILHTRQAKIPELSGRVAMFRLHGKPPILLNKYDVIYTPDNSLIVPICDLDGGARKSTQVFFDFQRRSCCVISTPSIPRVKDLYETLEKIQRHYNPLICRLKEGEYIDNSHIDRAWESIKLKYRSELKECEKLISNFADQHFNYRYSYNKSLLEEKKKRL